MQCSSPFSKRSGLKLMHPISYFDNLRSVRSNHSITILYKQKCGILRHIIHQYNRNIVESGVKHHNYNPLFPPTFSSYTFHIVMNTFLSKTYNQKKKNNKKTQKSIIKIKYWIQDQFGCNLLRSYSSKMTRVTVFFNCANYSIKLP